MGHGRPVEVSISHPLLLQISYGHLFSIFNDRQILIQLHLTMDAANKALRKRVGSRCNNVQQGRRESERSERDAVSKFGGAAWSEHHLYECFG